LAKESAETNLAKFSGITDPAKALEALEMMTKIDQKKLIDAGAVDQVRADITKSFQAQLEEANSKSQKLEGQLYDAMIGGNFSGSKFIADKIAIPSDMLQARFGQSFKVEEGKVVAYDGSGNKIYSRSKPGELLVSMKRWSSWSKITRRKTTSSKPVAIAAVVHVPVTASGWAENHETRCV
jgi:hypothetical protein